jgi:hypothetical protein
MSRMIDLIRVSAVPSTVMHSASKGALAVPPAEMVEILVHLATKNHIFGQQARFTLASWDEAACRTVAANPKTPKEVLDYLASPHNVRQALLPALLENPSVGDGVLMELAASHSKDTLAAMLKSPRIQRSQKIRVVLNQNPTVSTLHTENGTEKLATTEEKVPSGDEIIPPTGMVEIAEETGPAIEGTSDERAPTETQTTEDPASGDVLEEDVSAYLTEHAAEIAAEGDKPFQAIGGQYDELDLDEPVFEDEPEPAVEATKPPASTPAAPAKKKPVAKKTYLSTEEERGSVLQKIAKLDIKGRIQLAMKGNKEERSILIRDGTKLVALAVLESPKITDGEVERFASQKNVLEAVLRGIPMKRRFAKHYPVVRNLVSNPRTPLDLSLGLMKHLLTQDLKNLSGNKEVSDTVRKLALKMFKQKADPSKKNI